MSIGGLSCIHPSSQLRNPVSARGKTEQQEFDTVISAVGIVGNVENLGLEQLGVKIDRTHVVTDELRDLLEAAHPMARA